jgi:V8-like Glu-specific endopeptidase
MKPNRMAMLILVLVFVVGGNSWALAAPRSPAPQPAPAAQTAPAACLTGDPFKLAALAKVIGSPRPPSRPVRIGEDITIAFVRAGSMSDGESAADFPPLGKPPHGTRDPAERPANQVRIDNAPLRIFNTRTKLEYRVFLSDRLLRTISTCHQRTGRTEAGGPADLGVVEGKPVGSAVQGGPIQPMGWSTGDDSRILRTPTTLWPWRTITQSSSWPDGEQSRCTMTLIGPRHLITAAHCLVNFGTSSWKTRKLTPARDGVGVDPYGFSQMTPTPPPGTEAWYLVPDQWVNPATPDDGNQYQWDIGLVLMVDRLGDQTGWMGYGAWTAGDLNQRDHLNRGYPGCQESYEERPEGCEMARLYGDTEYCEIGEYHHPGSNGWNRNFSFGCDISRGHSGSPLYHYRTRADGTQVPAVAAVVSWHECYTCTEDDDFPNHARRITPWMLGNISWLREQFP